MTQAAGCPRRKINRPIEHIAMTSPHEVERHQHLATCALGSLRRETFSERSFSRITTHEVLPELIDSRGMDVPTFGITTHLTG